MLYHLGIFYSQKDGFSKVKDLYIISTYYSICDDYSVNADQTWMNGDWLFTTKYGVFDDKGMASEGSPPGNLKWWIIIQSKDFTKK